MMSRFVIISIWFVFIVSMSALLFFILAINPKYLNLSGFLLFYASVFGACWSVCFLLWRYALRRGKVRDFWAISRQAIFLSLCVVALLFLSQTRALSFYTIVPFAALFIFTQYVILKKR